MTKIAFERALFFSWYCKLGDCSFCYMSLLKDKIQDPKKAKRRIESVLAEAVLCRHFGWDIEFLSGGYESYSFDELVFLTKSIYEIMGEKLWLNLGTLRKDELEAFKPYINGYAGTIETVNWDIRKKVCPSKHLAPILKTFKHCDELGLEKSITIIIGLGETIEDIKELEKFVKEHGISRITFYALNPHPDTPHTESPSLEYYVDWIRQTRELFPNLDIIAGAWDDKSEYYKELINAGANSITKLPVIRHFGSTAFKQIEDDVRSLGHEFQGTLSELPDKEISYENVPFEYLDRVKAKVESYMKRIRKNLE